MHIADVESGNLGANGIVAGGIPIAVGAALAIKKQKRDDVALLVIRAAELDPRPRDSWHNSGSTLE